MIPRNAHPEPEAAWNALAQWFQQNGRMPSGEPFNEHVIKVLMVGAWIGARFSAIYTPFGLALCEQGNAFAAAGTDIMGPLNVALNNEYHEWLVNNVDNYVHNMGFDIKVEALVETPDGKAHKALTEDDAKSIADAMEDFFRGEQSA